MLRFVFVYDARFADALSVDFLTGAWYGINYLILFCKTWKKKADGRKSLQEPDESEFFSKDYMEEKEEGPIQHHEQCEFCKDAGELILCEYCPRAYHLKCLNPPQVDIPDGAWLCPFCSSEPMPAKIAKILSWRWAEAPYTEIDDDRPGKEGQKRKLWGHKVRIFF